MIEIKNFHHRNDLLKVYYNGFSVGNILLDKKYNRYSLFFGKNLVLDAKGIQLFSNEVNEVMESEILDLLFKRISQIEQAKNFIDKMKGK